MGEVNKARPPLKDRMIPWYFVMAFGVVFIVNAVFVYLATASHSGVVTEHAYNKGLDYNATILAAHHQQELGWQGAVAYEGGMLQYRLKDVAGKALHAAAVEAFITRPLQSGQDFSLTLAEDEGEPGLYEAAVQFPMKGVWDVVIVATWNRKQFQQKQRLVVP